MPVWWAEPGNNPGIHGGQISIPGGVVTDNGTLSAMPQAADAGLASIEFYGGTFSRDHVWRQLNRSLVSPDGSSYVYTTSDGPTISTAIHVVDLATNTDAVVYGSPQTLYFPIAYEADGIYLVHAVNPKQGTFENLYRLNPAGGTPQLVSGSDRPMYGWSWVLIADGAAWGIGYRTTGNDYIYSIMRLDLTTSQVTDWMDGAVGDLIWPMGVDLLHRLYVEDQSALWQVAAPGQASSLPDPIPAAGDVAPRYDSGPGAVPAFLADTQGEWFAGTNGIWLYRDGAAPTQFYAGPTGSAVYPGGPCT
jgi:hypothetical protein